MDLIGLTGLLGDPAQPNESLASRRLFFSITFLMLFVVLLYVLGLFLSPFVVPTFWAIVLARLVSPLHRTVRGWVGERESLAAFAVTLFALVVGIIPASYLVSELLRESVNAYNQASAWVKGGGPAAFLGELSQRRILGLHLQEVIGGLIVAQPEWQDALLSRTAEFGSSVVLQLTGVAANLVKFVLDLLVTSITLFFLLRDGDKLFDWMYRMIPLDDGHKTKIVTRLDVLFTAVVRGTFLSSLTQGLVSGAAFWALGVPFPVLLGSLATLFAFFPILGTMIVWLPVAAYLLMIGALWKALIMLLIGFCVIDLIDDFLLPYLVGSATSIPVLLLFFSSLGGLAYAGFMGLLLGPILLGILLTAFGIYEDEFQLDRPRLITPGEIADHPAA
jgi:predicted PurR-regulated permease PerM